MSRRAILILAGGAGTRLWPLSTDERPKQFLTIFRGESLMQRAVARLRGLVPDDQIYFATNERYRDLIRQQIPFVPPGNILPEPARKNTLPAIASACAEIEKRSSGTTVGIFPSDHYVGDEEEFRRLVALAFGHAEESDDLVTLGIRPTEPNTGFGYLELGETVRDGVRRTLRYVEKPDRARAEELIRDPAYVWNGGMFLWRIATFQSVLRDVAPEVAALATRIAASVTDDEKRALYRQMPEISIDFGVMEKAPAVATVPGEFGWSDVGSWSAVARLTESDARLILEEAEGVHVRAPRAKPVIVVGLSNLAVIDTPDGLLVVSLSSAESVSPAVRRLQED